MQIWPVCIAAFFLLFHVVTPSDLKEPSELASSLNLHADPNLMNLIFSESKRRAVRQLGGFDWDAPNPNAFNNNNWGTGDNFVFEDDWDRRSSSTRRPATSTVAIPGMGTRRSDCENRCLTTPEFNPVCADDNMTYANIHKFRCARLCGKRINVKYYAACPRF